MRLSELKYVKVGDRNFPIKITNRAMMEYESLTGEAVISFKGSERRSKLFYVTAKAGAKSTGEEFNYDYEGFLDVIDDYYAEVLEGFRVIILGLFDSDAPEDTTEDQSKKK